MRRLPTWVLMATAIGLVPVALGAQDPRSQMIEDARIEFDDSAALDLLLAAASPVDGAVDSLASVAVYDVAQMLLNQDIGPLASVWLRWIARHGAEWPIGRDAYLLEVVAAFDAARAQVVPETSDGLTQTSWRWPEAFDADADGSLEIGSSNSGTGLSVQVTGQGDLSGSESMGLEAGTYELIASAAGYESVSFTREVLPGAVTVLDVTLPPVLSADAVGVVSQWLVRVDRSVQGQGRCGTGFIAERGGLILTTIGVSGTAGGLDVVAFGGLETHTDVRIAASDELRNVVVLELDGDPGAIARAPTPLDGSFAWAMYHPGCGAAETSWTRLRGWSDAGGQAVVLATELPAGAAGAPLVDRTGGVLGIVIDPTHVLPIAQLEALLEQAGQDQVVLTSGGGGGVPTWLWIALGVGGAAGAAVALGGGGGGDDGGGGGVTPPTTGGITISFPLGGN